MWPHPDEPAARDPDEPAARDQGQNTIQSRHVQLNEINLSAGKNGSHEGLQLTTSFIISTSIDYFLNLLINGLFYKQKDISLNLLKNFSRIGSDVETMICLMQQTLLLMI